MRIALWSYIVGLLGAWSVLHLASDRWWVATLLLFAPRWLWGLPLAAFAVPVAIRYPRLLGLLGLAGVIVAVPIMGLCLPWRMSLASRSTGLALRVLTCNSDARDLDPERFRALVDEVRPGVVVMQDVWVPHVNDVFGSDGWYVHVDHGMCIASRYPIRAAEALECGAFGPGLGRSICYDLETPAGIVHCVNLHLATPRWGLLAVVDGESQGAEKLQSNSDLRRDQSAALRRRVDALGGPVLLAGDFNTPVESTIYRESWSDFINAFSTAGLGWGNTHLTRHTRVRIDHVLTSPDLGVRRCWVGPDVGSAHRPLIADLVWTGPTGATSPPHAFAREHTTVTESNVIESRRRWEQRR